MAEYIEREALLNALKEERKNGNFVFTSKWIKEIMDNLPTADVVPKSEVDWNMIPVDVSEALKQRAVEKAKSEVVREIFVEIERLHLHITNEFDVRRYAELKKKYTEEKT